MTPTVALLVARLALGADGGTLDAVYSVCPDVTNTPDAVAMDGGWFLPTPRPERLACRLSGCEAALREAEAQPVSTPVAVAVAFGVGVVLGVAATGYVAWRLR